MTTKIGGNYKSVDTDAPGPWADWPETDRAERAIRWIETYCIPSKGHGAGQPLKLAEFQKQWIREVLRDGVRSAVLSLPRGNGKSSLIGALACWALFDSSDGQAPQIPVVASTVSQAIRTSYGAALDFTRNHPELAKRAKIYSAIGGTKIEVPSTGGVLFPAADSVDSLQGLDPSMAVADELAFLHVESWDSLLLASGKRPRSLVIGIGSPGPSKDCALWHLRQTWLEGNELPGFRYCEFSAPDGCAIDDEQAWRIANPAIDAGYLSIDAMRMAMGIAPQGEFRIFRLGQWVDGVESWLGPDGGKLWQSLTRSQNPVPGAPTWCGVDVALRHDSTAVVCVQNAGDAFYSWAKIWTPKDGETLDTTDVMQYLRECAEEYDVKAISYDPRFFMVPAQILADEGYPLVELPQSTERMTKACGRAFDLIQQGKVFHDGDALFGQHVLNAVPRYNAVGFTLGKAKARGKIDACIALCLALERAEQLPEKPRSPVFVI